LIDEELVVRIVYAGFRRAWEEERWGGRTDPSTIFVTDVTQCLLKSWYQRVLDYSPSDEKVALLVMGDDVHYLMREILGVGEGELGLEKELGDGVKLRGRVDRVLGDCVLEFKTVSRAPEKPYDNHIKQIQLYMWLADKGEGFIVYVSRADGRVKAFRVLREDEVVAEMAERARRLSESLRQGIPPEPEPSKLCKYCEYNTLCPALKSGSSTQRGRAAPGST